MTDQEKEQMLLEERYATIRSQVRDDYISYNVWKRERANNSQYIEELSHKKNIFNFISINKQIKEALKWNEELDRKIQEIEDKLQPYDDEMKEIESKLGSRLEALYGREQGWWIKK